MISECGNHIYYSHEMYYFSIDIGKGAMKIKLAGKKEENFEKIDGLLKVVSRSHEVVKVGNDLFINFLDEEGCFQSEKYPELSFSDIKNKLHFCEGKVFSSLKNSIEPLYAPLGYVRSCKNKRNRILELSKIGEFSEEMIKNKVEISMEIGLSAYNIAEGFFNLSKMICLLQNFELLEKYILVFKQKLLLENGFSDLLSFCAENELIDCQRIIKLMLEESDI